MLVALAPAAAAQTSTAGLDPRTQAEASPQTQNTEAGSRSDLEHGISLTRQGRFTEAIPYLLATREKGIGGYSTEFNLALCYVGAERYREAVTELLSLQKRGLSTAAVKNLLAQAYIGEHDAVKAWAAIEEASRLAPTDEKMYAFLLNSCTDHYEYSLGLKAATLGLQSLPHSARLHYERAVFLARLDRLDDAKPEFNTATELDPDGDIGYLASVQKLLYENDLPHALEMARRAVKTGHRDYQTTSLLGTVLMYMGVTPGQPQFAEARNSLETSVTERPDFSTSQIALGKLYLMEGRSADAVAHLEIGRRLEPQNPAVYTSLASAYRRLGNKEASAECMKTLAGILEEKTGTGTPGTVQAPTPR